MPRAKSMQIHQQTIEVPTSGKGLFELTRDVERIVKESGVSAGLCVVFCRHTSASLVIQENADPSASRDLVQWFERIAPEGDPQYTHTAEGPDDMPSHIRSSITKTSESIPIAGGRLSLGTWQGIFLFEHRTAPHRRTVVVHVQGN